MAALFEGAIRNWKFVVGFVVLSIGFWTAEFAYQSYFASPGEPIEAQLTRASSLTGATFIGLSLLSSSIFRWVPKWGKYWYVRRSLGVVGTMFALAHVYIVINNYFGWDLGKAFPTWNPMENPLVFGLLALPIFVLMAFTSTDWAYQKIGFPRWKTLHRLVYLAYFFMVVHFLVTYPAALQNAAGYLLISVTVAALAGELYWFLRTAWGKRFRSLGSVVGFFIIFLWLMFIYIALFMK